MICAAKSILYTSPMTFTIRNVVGKDLDAVLELNEAVVPAVNSIPLSQMQWFLDNAAYFRLAEGDGQLLAFLVGLRPGTEYHSVNYRYFCKHYADFAYVDRIAVSRAARRSGLASTLYDDFRASVVEEVSVMTCEVNLRPPNEGSMRFHERLGFRQVAEQESEGGSKTVALLVRQL